MEQQEEGGVRYITEELLLKLAGSRSLAQVRSLNLSSAPGDRCIKFVENLHGCRQLRVLNLNHNMIERMERLNALTQLRDLQMAHNHIQRIEGLELLSNLQHLNLSYNRIEHVPVWLGKKLHSLHTLQLQHNLITSLYEVSRLGSLSSLSELSVSGNPASLLPHSRLFLLFHLRTLDELDELPVTQEERRRADQRFNVEELQRLQQEVDSSQSELSRLQGAHQTTMFRLRQQEEANHTLTSQIQIQGHAHTLLEQEVHTKSQLLFFRARLFFSSPAIFSLLKLEKTTAELTRAFHKLYELEQELAFYKIDSKLSLLHPCSTQDVIAEESAAESPYIGKARYVRHTFSSSTSPASIREHVELHSDVELSHLDAYKTQQTAAEAEFLLVAHDAKQQWEAEQFNPTDTEAHNQGKVSVLELQRDEAEEAERQKEEADEPETQSLTPDSTDQHAHVTTHLSSGRQMLDRMSTKQSELDGRLDDMLSRIGRETQEIKELEQQLTDGQILANEALQRDLEEIISGLQEYLRGLRYQAHCAQLQVYSVQAENQSLKLQLEEMQRHCRQLEDTARTHGQLQCEALRAEVDKEKLVTEIRECQLQSAIDTLQDEKSSLQQTVHNLQTQLDQTKANLDQSRIQHRSGLEQNSPDLSSVEQLYKIIQRTGASGEQSEHNHNHSQAQPAHSQGPSAHLEDGSTHKQDHIHPLKAEVGQDHKTQNLDWRLKEELERLRAKLQNRNRFIQQNLESQLEQSRLQLQDVQQQRDELLQQLRSQTDRHQRSFGRLSRKLRQLSRSMCDSDHLTAEHLKSAVEQLRALTRTVELLRTQMDELSSSPHQPEHGHVQQDQHTVEELRTQLAEAQRLIHRLRQQLDRIRTRNQTWTGISQRHGGRWCLVPGHSAPSLGSQGTQDLGLGLQHLSSAGGYWVYFPPHVDTAADQSDGDRSTTGGDADRHDPPAGPSWLLCGSPAAVVSSPPVGGAALHCNIPEHGDPTCERKDREAKKLEEKKKKLRLETKQLCCSLRRHRSVRLVCEEVECVESTLLKRRAELRRADRLLLEAQSCIHTAEDTATSVQWAAQDSATCLQETTQQLRERQQEVEHLRRRRQQEQQTLRVVQEVLRSRDQEFQQLGSKIQSATGRLSALLSDCQEAQTRLDSVSTQELQQQEQLLCERSSAVTAVREEEQKLLSLQSEVSAGRAELKQLLQELLVEQQALKEAKTKRTHVLQQLHRTKGELDRTTDDLDTAVNKLRRKLEEMDRMRIQLDWIRDEVDKTKDELEKKQQEVNGKMNELDQTQDQVTKKREELSVLQQEAESCLTSLKQQRTELQELQEELRRRREERSSLQEQSKHLEARRRHADRCLSAVEEELTKRREELGHAQFLKQEVLRDPAAAQEQELSSSRQQQRERLKGLEHQVELKQVACVGLEDVKAALHQLEDRRRCLTENRLQLDQLGEELLHKEAGLKQQREKLQEGGVTHRPGGATYKREGATPMEEGLQQKLRNFV